MALGWAAVDGLTEAVKLAIENGVDFHTPVVLGQQPILLAVTANRHEVLKALIAAGANCDVKSQVCACMPRL